MEDPKFRVNPEVRRQGRVSLSYHRKFCPKRGREGINQTNKPLNHFKMDLLPFFMRSTVPLSRLVQFFRGHEVVDDAL